MSPDLFDYAASKEARDQALEKVAMNSADFMSMALAEIEKLPPGWHGTGEDARKMIIGRGIEPHHHNAWGALIRTAVAKRILVGTGQYISMRSVTSHARRTQVYRRPG